MMRRFPPAIVLALALAGCPAAKTGLKTAPPAETLIKATSGVVANNAGRIVGKVKNGPVGLMTEGNNGTLIADQAGALRLLAAVELVAVSGARCEVTDSENQVVSVGTATTDAEGTFSIRRFKPSPTVLYVRAEYAAGDQTVVLRAIVSAPRKAGSAEVTVDPAASLIAKKTLAMLRAKAFGATAVDAALADKLARAVATELDGQTLTAAALGDDAEAARAFDKLLDRKPALDDKLRALCGTNAMGRLLEPTPAGADGGTGIRPWLSLRPPTANLVAASGKTVLLGGSGQKGFADGPAATAKFDVPYDIATDDQGNAYVADSDNHRVRKIAPDGTVSTVAGTGQPGWKDGPGAEAQFNALAGVAVGPDGALYVADFGNHRIRRVKDGVVTTLAGNSAPGFTDGIGEKARFSAPSDLTVDPAGNVYVADTDNHRIRLITPGGVVTTVGGVGIAGLLDGAALEGQLSGPSDVAIDSRGRLFVADTGNHAIRMIADGRMTTMAGNGTAGFADGSGNTARFNTPFGIAVGPAGILYVADSANHSVRMVTPGGGVSTWWGEGGPLTDPPQGVFNGPSGVAIRPDAQGIPEVYVADSGLHVLRKFALAKPAGTASGTDANDGLAPK